MTLHACQTALQTIPIETRMIIYDPHLVQHEVSPAYKMNNHLLFMVGFNLVSDIAYKSIISLDNFKGTS